MVVRIVSVVAAPASSFSKELFGVSLRSDVCGWTVAAVARPSVYAPVRRAAPPALLLGYTGAGGGRLALSTYQGVLGAVLVRRRVCPTAIAVGLHSPA